MIARLWVGSTPARYADEYASYVARTGARALAATPGNRGVLVLRRIEGGHVRFAVLSLWGSVDDVRGFAGEDVERAVYYPEDRRYLDDLPPLVRHYEVVLEA